MARHGLEVVSVALDRSSQDARPWAAAAGVTHPACVDPGHRVAELLGMVNVPMVAWLDETGEVVRPADTQFATQAGAAVSGFDWRAARAALRRWVLDGGVGVSAQEHARAATFPEQQARTHWSVAKTLAERGDVEGARRHLDVAGRLAPHDFTIRRAGLVLTGQDPFGDAYFAMREQVLADGGAVYHPPSGLARRGAGGVVKRPAVATPVVLGMVEAGFHTGYAIAAAVARSTSAFWPAGQNAIYPELKRLIGAGLLEVVGDGDGRRPRDHHTLTAAGEAMLDRWRTTHDDLRIEQRDEGLLKLHFGDALTVSQARPLLDAACACRRERLAAMEQVRPIRPRHVREPSCPGLPARLR